MTSRIMTSCGLFCRFSTYYAGFDEPVPAADADKSGRAVSYYQWVPIVLLSLAVLCVCPHVLWRCASKRAGINVSDVIETSQSYQKAMYAEPRDNALRYVVAQVIRCPSGTYLLTRLSDLSFAALSHAHTSVNSLRLLAAEDFDRPILLRATFLERFSSIRRLSAFGRYPVAATSAVRVFATARRAAHSSSESGCW